MINQDQREDEVGYVAQEMEDCVIDGAERQPAVQSISGTFFTFKGLCKIFKSKHESCPV